MTNTTRLSRRAAGLLLLAAGSVAMMASTAAIAQDKVIRVLRSPVGTFQGLFIAEEQGYFAEKGLKVEISIGGSPDQNVAQLQAGQTDLIMTAAASVSTAVAQGLPLLAVLNTQDQGDTPTTGLQVPPNSPIKTVADLKGKKIGISGVTSPQAIALYRALRTAGMTPADVTLVNMGFDTMIESAERATVDAIMPVGLFYPLAASKGFVAIPEVYNEIKGTAAVIFATSKAFADANGETLKAFTEAMLKAYEYANANPDAVRAVDTAQTKMPPDYIATRYIAPFIGTFQRDKWAAMNTDMVEFGFIPRAPEEAEYIWEGTPQ